MSVHLSDDQLVDRLYGICDAGSEHLDTCPDCQLRWSRIQLRRDQAVAMTFSSQQLRQQRRRILNRLAAPPPPARMLWVPVTAAVVILMSGLVITTPKAHAPIVPEPAPIVEAGWFEDTYSAMRVMEPRAASPIRQLFFGDEIAE